DRRHAPGARPLHAAHRVRALRRDGRRLLPVPRTARLLADDESGPAGDSLLLRLSLSLGRGRGTVESRCAAGEAAIEHYVPAADSGRYHDVSMLFDLNICSSPVLSTAFA